MILDDKIFLLLSDIYTTVGMLIALLHILYMTKLKRSFTTTTIFIGTLAIIFLWLPLLLFHRPTGRNND